MKTIINKFFAVTLSVLLMSSYYSFAADVTPGPSDHVQAIYDYSNFQAAGSFTSINSPYNKNVTRVYANAQVSGYETADKNFIINSVTTLYGGGALKQQYTPASNGGSVTNYDEDGTISPDGQYQFQYVPLMVPVADLGSGTPSTSLASDSGRAQLQVAVNAAQAKVSAAETELTNAQNALTGGTGQTTG